MLAATAAVAVVGSAIGSGSHPHQAAAAQAPGGQPAPDRPTSTHASMLNAAEIRAIAAPGWFVHGTGAAGSVRPGQLTTGAAAGDQAPVSELAASGIPSTALVAYQGAAAREATRRPACGIGWPLLAAIGRVESDHGRFAGAVLHADGVSTPRIIGIPLDGNGTALIRDTDGGRLDGDPVYDRAVGPMQFIPSTWAGWGVDANHDGVKDPFNIFDAAAAAADYLCAAGRDLRTYAGEVQAVRSYNNSDAYIASVLQLERAYASGAGVIVPVLPVDQNPVKVRHRLPPVDPGKPRGLKPPTTPTPTPTPRTSRSSTSAAPTTASTSDSPTTAGSSTSSSPTRTRTSSGSTTSTPSPTTSTPTPTTTPTPTCPPPTSSTATQSSTTPAGASSSTASGSDSTAPPSCPDPTPTSGTPTGADPAGSTA